ncbi:piggyBac transposable element-derived protein 4-like [Hyperolius riggenbachi]|uniref:piggyBac transposable element-derived protein 4-like n=1 Tax=Hyperolius riggenbachi TaxID=752182 RepID=UPI0035A2DD87
MAKRMYSLQEAFAILERDSDSHSSSEFEDDLESTDIDWLPSESESDSTDSDSESAGPSTAQPSRSAEQARGISDTDTASEGGSPIATSSNAIPRGQRAARPRQSMPARVPQREPLPYDLRDPQWSASNMETPNLPPFTARSGLLVDTSNMQPIDFFELFLPESFLQYVCDQSNIYAQQRIADHPTCVLASHWTPATTRDLKVFLGLTFDMALSPLPEQQLYWTKNPILCIPIYSSRMSRRRYQMLLTCLHFSNNADHLPPNDPAHDRLFKLRPFIDHLNRTFTEKYMPEQRIAIDESLIPFHGRLAIKQYIPNKRSRYGIKLYKLCESGSGYIYSLKVYEGKDSLIQPPGCPPYMGTTERIVLDLLNPLLHQGYHLYVDNFYTSVPLFKHLFSVQTPACGTVRANRKGLPSEVVHKKLKRGETCSQRSNELLALKFRDKRDVLALTTIHTEATTTVRTRSREVVKPLAIAEYTKFMGAVDLSDQVLAPYRLNRKRKIWYKKVALYFFQMCLQNAFVLYKKSGNRDSFLKFQLAIITCLLFESGQPAPNPDQLRAENVARFEGNHFPAPLPPTASKPYPQKRCRVCRKNHVRRDTRYHCPKCPSKAALCLNPCFETYHTVLHY